MHRIVDSAISCGVKELVGLGLRNDSDPVTRRELVEHVAHNRINQGGSFSTILFSDSTRYGNGEKLARYITRHNLGKVIASPKHINPNSSQEIQVWMWVLNTEELRKFLPKNVTDEDHDRIQDWEMQDEDFASEVQYA